MNTKSKNSEFIIFKFLRNYDIKNLGTILPAPNRVKKRFQSWRVESGHSTPQSRKTGEQREQKEKEVE